MFTRWPMSDVQNEMQRLQDEINRLFGRDGRRTFSTSAAFPAMNLWEDGEGFVVEAELPGIAMDDIEIFVDGGNQLTVKGRRSFDRTVWNLAPTRTAGTVNSNAPSLCLPMSIRRKWKRF